MKNLFKVFLTLAIIVLIAHVAYHIVMEDVLTKSKSFGQQMCALITVGIIFLGIAGKGTWVTWLSGLFAIVFATISLLTSWGLWVLAALVAIFALCLATLISFFIWATPYHKVQG